MLPGGYTHPISEPGTPKQKDRPRTRKREPGRDKGFYRPGRRMAEVFRRIDHGDLTWEIVALNMTDSELARRQFKDKNGKFSGRPLSMLPRGFLDACDAELARRGQVTYLEAVPDARATMIEIMMDKSQKAGDRLKAAQWLAERVEGKTPERIIHEAGQSTPWETMIMGVVAELPVGEEVSREHRYATEDIQDAEVVDDEGQD